MLGKCSHPHLLNEEDGGDGTYIGVGAGLVGPVLTGPLFRKKLVGVTIITINTCVLHSVVKDWVH